MDGANRMCGEAAVGGEARRAHVVQLGVEARVDGANVMSGEAVVGVETLGGRGDSGHQGEQGDGLGEEKGSGGEVLGNCLYLEMSAG